MFKNIFAGCLLRMTENFLTEDKFRKGVSEYLKKYSYGNAQTKDLWASLSEEADNQLPPELNVSQIMDTWTSQPGYPLVTYDGHTLTQARFFLNSSAGKLSTYTHSYILELPCTPMAAMLLITINVVFCSCHIYLFTKYVTMNS